MIFRKRRRQLWHAKQSLAAPKKTRRGKLIQKHSRTKDGGLFEQPLGKQKALITLKQKLEVLDRVDELLKQKQEAKLVLIQPRLRNLTRDQREKLNEQILGAEEVIRMNIQHVVSKEFPQLTRKSQVCKWRKSCEREQWRQMPEAVLSRVTATSNAWRSKMGLKGKGGHTLKKVPAFIQQELDLLMMEACGGLSDVTERKEIVSMEDLASQPRWFCIILKSPKFHVNVVVLIISQSMTESSC